MAGNAAEWCWDNYGIYGAEPQKDPHGPDFSINRVVRGGSWWDDAQSLRCARRNSSKPASANDTTGFRTARNQP